LRAALTPHYWLLTTNMLKSFFYYFIFPGFLFAASVGLIAGWVDRKVTARLQWRKGPPWHQNFTDIVKLIGKEVIVPANGRWVFLLAPFIGLLAASLVAALVGVSIIHPQQSFVGDLIVVLYLLTIPAISMIIAASSCGNPLASVGASREIKLVLGYELPFIISIVAMAIKSSGAIQLGSILNIQAAYGSNIASWSGFFAFIVVIFCIQAKLGFVPFDASEAEQEIVGGVLIDYSGVLLALFKLTKAVLLYTLPLFMIILFMGKDLSLLFLALKYTGILVIIILIKNTNPRLRIDQAMRFFWGPVTLLAIAALILASIGL